MFQASRHVSCWNTFFNLILQVLNPEKLSWAHLVRVVSALGQKYILYFIKA